MTEESEEFEEWKKKMFELAKEWRGMRADLIAEVWPRTGLEWHARSDAVITACEARLSGSDLMGHIPGYPDAARRNDWNYICDELAVYNRFYKNHSFAEVKRERVIEVESAFESSEDLREEEIERDRMIMAQRPDWFPWAAQQLGLDARSDWPMIVADMQYLVERIREGELSDVGAGTYDIEVISDDLLMARLLCHLITCEV